MKSFISLLYIALTPVVLGATYHQTDSHQGIGFLKSFSHQAISDPTHGRVCVLTTLSHSSMKRLTGLCSQYVDQQTALAENLTYAFSDTFIIRADHTSKLNPSGPGRKSVRIQSHKKYLNHVAM